jgi:hypothetical protein
LNAIRRATDVEINLVVPEIGADAGRLRKRLRIASAKLKANGMLEWIEGKKTQKRRDKLFGNLCSLSVTLVLLFTADVVPFRPHFALFWRTSKLTCLA